jgi:predicted hydrocarbon binding protein
MSLTKKKEEAEKEVGKYQTAFFILPAEALITLRDELSPLANEDAIRAIMFRYGYRSGEACAQSMGIRTKNPKGLAQMLPGLWEEIGLGKLIIKKQKKEGMEIELDESIEANVIGDVGKTSCDFTRGYLAGTVSFLSGKRYHCKEDKCLSNGDSKCAFILNKREKTP